MFHWLESSMKNATCRTANCLRQEFTKVIGLSESLCLWVQVAGGIMPGLYAHNVLCCGAGEEGDHVYIRASLQRVNNAYQRHLPDKHAVVLHGMSHCECSCVLPHWLSVLHMCIGPVGSTMYCTGSKFWTPLNIGKVPRGLKNVPRRSHNSDK